MQFWKLPVLVVALLGGLSLFAYLAFPPRGGNIRPGGIERPARPDIAQQQPTDEQLVNTASSTESKDDSNSQWNEFRGPGGSGFNPLGSAPASWSDDKNIVWKTKLPGAGSSSPIVWGDFVFVTSYSGYAAQRNKSGEASDRSGSIEQLKRALTKINRKTGEIIWTVEVPALMPEDPYTGNGLPEHGYSTNTPVTDGMYVFVFYGKSGVLAYDYDGKEIWKVSVGKESGNRGWGSAASLILDGERLIVNASEESQSIRALDKKTGKEIWSAPASTLELVYATPRLVKTPQGRTDLVIGVPGEVWGLNPTNGKLTWFAKSNMTGNVSPSVVADQEKLYVFGGYRASGSMAIRLDGQGDVTSSHVAWKSKNTSYVSTPLLHNGHLYWFDDKGVAFCSDAETGEQIYRERIPGISSGGRPVYASPIRIGDKIFVQTRWDGVYVLPAEPVFKVLEQNKIESDPTDFNATPANVDQQIFLRSQTHLYCIG